MAATRATSLDILCPASRQRDCHELQPIIRGRTCRAPAHLRSNFAQSTGVENADQTVPVFNLNTAHSYFIRLSTPIALSVQLCGTNPVPGKFAGGGGTVVGCTFKYILDAHSCSGLGFQARTPRARLTDTSHLIHRLTTNIMTKTTIRTRIKKSRKVHPRNGPTFLVFF